MTTLCQRNDLTRSASISRMENTHMVRIELKKVASAARRHIINWSLLAREGQND